MAKQAKSSAESNNGNGKDDSSFLRTRLVVINEEINGKVAKQVIRELEELKFKDDKTPIALIINSFGGIVYDAFAIMEHIRTLGVPVHTKTTGYAFSAGAAILSQGAKGHRVCAKNAVIMLHEIVVSFSGEMTHVNMEHDQRVKLNNQVMSILAINCGHKTKKAQAEFIEKIVEKRYFTAKEAKELGLIDTII